MRGVIDESSWRRFGNFEPDRYIDTTTLDRVDYHRTLAQQEQLLTELLDSQRTGIAHPTSAPWSTIDADIADVEASIAELKAKIGNT